VRSPLGRRRPVAWLSLPVLAGLLGCSRESTTALDLALDVTGYITEVEIQAVEVGGTPLDLSDEQRRFPSPPRDLDDDDVLTVWFADTAGGKNVTSPRSAAPAIGR
jgi:hypothetical protein